MYLSHVFPSLNPLIVWLLCTLISAAPLRGEGEAAHGWGNWQATPLNSGDRGRFVLCVDHTAKDVKQKKGAGSKTKRGVLDKHGLHQVSSEEAGLSGFNSWVLVGSFLRQLVPAMCSCVTLPTSFSCSLHSYEEWQLLMEKGCLLRVSLWALLRFAIVGLITLNKHLLLELSP